MERWMKNISIWLFVVMAVLSFVIPWAHAKTFKGRVIDADTKEPSEGAVVVVYWYSKRPSILGEDTRVKDVKETLTDRNGEWQITGPKGRTGPLIPFPIFVIATFRYTAEPLFIIFKPGYCSWPKGISIEACKAKIKPKETDDVRGGKTVELPKLTNREDRLMSYPHTISSGVDDPQEFMKTEKKQLELLRLLNEERRNLGLEEYPVYKELRDEK